MTAPGEHHFMAVKATTDHRHEVIAAPLDVGVYGMASWNGPRWMETTLGDNAIVWLAHASDDPFALVLTATCPRSRFDAWEMARRGVSDSASAAVMFGLDRLAEVVGPASPEPSVREVLRATLTHLRGQADRWSVEWPTSTWHLDDAAVSAWVLRFAGAWIGVTEDQPDAHVVAVGFGTDPDQLRLARFHDGWDYGVDWSQPLTIAAMTQARPPWRGLPTANTGTPHPDQRALLS